jgi:hypothetical protein
MVGVSKSQRTEVVVDDDSGNRGSLQDFRAADTFRSRRALTRLTLSISPLLGGAYDLGDRPQMNKTAQRDTSIPAKLPTAASLLGLKGQLRIRPHGSSQKAHVVLRPIESDDDSGDEGKDKNTLFFSLFAQKRIECKPGKEILVTMDTGPFKDRAIVFGGDMGEDDEEPEEEEREEKKKKRKKIEEQEEPIRSVMPPRMRKQWGRSETVPDARKSSCSYSVSQSHLRRFVAPLPPPPKQYQSVTVQTEPSTSTIGVSTTPLATARSVSVQTTPGLHPVALSTEPPKALSPPPTYTTTSFPKLFELSSPAKTALAPSEPILKSIDDAAANEAEERDIESHTSDYELYRVRADFFYPHFMSAQVLQDPESKWYPHGA